MIKMFSLVEKEYLNNNISNNIEYKLIKDFKKEDINDFILPIYKEYKELKYKIDKEVLIINKDNKINELEKYFLKLLIEFEIGGKRIKELERIVKLFENSLSKKYYKKSKQKSFKKVNVNDIPISQVIGKYINLPNNLNRNIKCPLHKEKTGSFKIYKKTNSFYCFGCKKGGNSINFISEIENISTKEAFKKFIEYF